MIKMLEAKNQIGTLVLLFITILVGITLISTIADETKLVTELAGVDNESLDISSARNATTNDTVGGFTPPVEITLSITDGLESFTELRQVNGSAFTKDTDYRVNLSTGGITMLETEHTGGYTHSNITLADYKHHRDDKYIQGSATARTIVKDLIVIFVIVGLLVWVYTVVIKQWLGDMI
jgi:hypothetical protein